MKKILICIDWFVPAYKAGGPIRSCLSIIEILKTKYEIYVYTSNLDQGSDESIVSAKELNCWSTRENNVAVYYSNIYTFKSIKKIVNEIRPDFIYLNSMWSLNFTIKWLFIYRNNKSFKVILAPRGMLHKGAMQFKNLKKRIVLKIGLILGIFDNIHFHATDNQEFKDISHKIIVHSQNSTISYIPNISFIPSNFKESSFITKSTDAVRLVFISRISPKKNLLYLIELLNSVNQKVNVVLNIFGPIEDRNYFDRCIESSKSVNDNIFVEFNSEIKFDEVYRRLVENHFFVLPTHGENYGHAIFESFVCSRPVIISNQTPWRNLTKHKAGFDLPLSDSSSFVNAIEIAAAMNQKEFDGWCNASFKYAENHIAKSNLKEEYFNLFS